ncbi:Hypothetical protein R9X50_00030400 [Acrodontium crateriforme]|uniref:CUE domain-containing protein n=1 Tax=Acrodontium crateriforme TaxID=150365 RepID=A0AAQ3LXJ1_9PEZI|nr:Hypothetical protein R9X50_00030400 [Acrodontium crateriforme]
MSLPPLAPIPPAAIRLSLSPPEWESCLDAWLTLLDFYVRSSQEQISSLLRKNDSVATFLKSLFDETASRQTNDETLAGPKARTLQRTAFILTNRLVSKPGLPASLLDWNFLSNFCRVNIRNAALPYLMSNVWKHQSHQFNPILQRQKDAITKSLEASSPTSLKEDLENLALLIRASTDVGGYFMTGSDFADNVVAAYGKVGDSEHRKPLVTTTYLGLLSLVKADLPNASLLSDHLYSLKSDADARKNGPSLLADLVTNTPLVPKLRRTVSGKSADRLVKLLDQVETYRLESLARPRKLVRRSKSKGKAKVHEQDAELHMHQMSLVAQIQDLFPDLGSGFIMKLLDEYNDDVEQVTAHLLDDSLPAHLQSLNRTEQAAVFGTTAQEDINSLAPRSTPPPSDHFIPQRHTAFEDDELDETQLGTARLHFGKKPDQQTPVPANKAAILSALAAFDSDDDERDDTYDVEDVGGTVDSAHPEGDPAPSAQAAHAEADAALFRTYQTSPELFGRSFDIRKGQARVALKRETGMTDEAIEGWAIMLQRDPRRLKRLQGQQAAFDGRQTALASTAYRESPAGTESEDSDVPGGSNGRGGFTGRGRGRGGRGRGRGGSVAGPAGDAGTAAAQKRKEANKGSRANHSRRHQRAKKMTRGGFHG